MPLIECKLGPTTQYVAGTPYTFEYDEFRRAVAEIHNLVHVQCFLSVEHYQEAPATPAPAPISTDEVTELPWSPRAGLILGLGEEPEAPEADAGAGDGDGAAKDDGESAGASTPEAASDTDAGEPPPPPPKRRHRRQHRPPSPRASRGARKPDAFRQDHH